MANTGPCGRRRFIAHLRQPATINSNLPFLVPFSMTDGQLPHLETFARAAELSSFTAAAHALGLTQAAVSQRIHALEIALNVSLFQRQGGRVLLTESGRRLHSYALRILDLHRQARAAVTAQHQPIG